MARTARRHSWTLLALLAVACSPEAAGPAPDPVDPPPPPPPAPASTPPAAHAKLADQGLDLLLGLAKLVEGLDPQGDATVDAEASATRLAELEAAIEALRAERLAMIGPRDAAGTEAVAAVYAQREERRGELFRRFNAASRKARTSQDLLLRAQVAAIHLMKALQVDAE